MRGAILRLLSGAFTYQLKPPTLTANQTLVLPNGTPISGQALHASGASGDTAWAYPRIGIRQTVLTGRRDTALEHAPPNALSSSGLNVVLNCSTSDPFSFTIADGLSDYGPIDLTGNISTTVASNTTSYIYINRSSAGTISLASINVAPIYSFVTPTSPVNNQHWFDLGKFQMKLWNGSTWTSVTRLFIGEVVATTSIQNVITYAYQGRYSSAWLSVGSYGAYNFNHNLGVQPSIGCIVQVYVNSIASDVGAVPAYIGDSAYGMYYSNTTGPVTRNQSEISWGQYVHLDNGVWATTAYAKLFIRRGW